MSRLEVVGTHCPALLALLCLVVPAHAQDAAAPRAAAEVSAEFLSDEAVAPTEAREANPIVERIEALRAELAADRGEVIAVEKSAREAKGADLVALRTQARELRLETRPRPSSTCSCSASQRRLPSV